MELSCIVGSIFYFYGYYGEFPSIAKTALYVFNVAFPGEMYFHTLTCVERYLAVVHPITYRRLRQSWGVRIRNISIGCIWLLCFQWICVKILYNSNFPFIPFFSCLAFSLLVVSFCSFSVLSVLIRPGPGDVGGDDRRVDRLKHRAFHTVMAILAVLWLWFVGVIVCYGLDASSLLSYDDGCVVMMLGMWFCLPSSLVLPLLFLHRAGKLCRNEE
ncbi:hypothetical protein Q5P01_002921 [Channa striata]|uniref:G-protein coupled receptors family 1 profile domain-containing protein n=1 Tax=Channa striata TaxID=64152 RepID=A0AA88T6P0_CHASR|nr:hypothetical protein Q5P01_002921 [Channa striata]